MSLRTLSLASLIDSNLINTNLYKFSFDYLYNNKDLFISTLITLCNNKLERNSVSPIYYADKFYYIIVKIISLI